MSAVGFLKTNPNPTREQLAHGISGNLCRCADYNKILNAMMRGAENTAEGASEWQMRVRQRLFARSTRLSVTTTCAARRQHQA